jgi:hypothetical protein
MFICVEMVVLINLWIFQANNDFSYLTYGFIVRNSGIDRTNVQQLVRFVCHIVAE